MTTQRTCMHGWTDNDGKPGSLHMCGEPHGHDGKHKCASCDATHDGALPLEAATRIVVEDKTDALIDAIEALFALPTQPKPGDVADRVARFLDLIGTAPARELAAKIRDARHDGDRLMSLLPELEKLEVASTAVRS